MDVREWQEKYTMASKRAERVRRMIIDRMRSTCVAAGLDPRLLGIHPHNAMVSYKAGQPWPGVNYSLVRKVLWLERKSWEPGRLAEAYGSRLWKQVKL